ncbi:dihydrofolate reductase family protein [Propylenella binzhouense]|uniref:Dihydrofolate reductase n=1 Tax=Propylenella binzhouense TaxID=2555902 RepID=A0A964WSJ0_9HYPH|nr:dihydrofolate reductase family protein [Propylenella binzhouense]MYZ46926.1 dihydrofolate reductase [Propylenella binzhouense]
MRKLVVWNLMTLDGSFEGAEKWDLAFHEAAWGDELGAFSLRQAEEFGTLLFGRVTFEGMAAYWSKATGTTADFMNGVEKVVASRTPAKVDWNNSRLLEGELPGAVERLKQQPGKDIGVFGSADLLAALLRHELVDELRICIAPVVLGRGNPLFKPSDRALALKLTRTMPLKTGGVILYYEPQYQT